MLCSRTRKRTRGLVEVGVGIIPGWGGCKEMILRARRNARSEQFAKRSRQGRQKESLVLAADVNADGRGASRLSKPSAPRRLPNRHSKRIDLGYFRESDNVTMNRDRLLYDAKQRALGLAKDYKPPVKVDDLRLPGAGGKMALDLAVSDLKKSGKATPYDVVVSDALANVLTGGKKGDWTVKLTEDDLLKLELSEFMKLLHNDGTLARIEYMLDNGKPLRN
jgi:3-hydroxyacyl-CoA dehydrogenase